MEIPRCISLLELVGMAVIVDFLDQVEELIVVKVVAEESQVDPCFAVEVEPVVEVDNRPHFDYLVVDVGESEDSCC